MTGELPEDVLREICKYLQYQDLQHLVKVNEYMSQFISSHWEFFFVDQFPQYKHKFEISWKKTFKTVSALFYSEEVNNNEFLKCPICASKLSIQIKKRKKLERNCIKCTFSAVAKLDSQYFKSYTKPNFDRVCCEDFCDNEIAGACINCDRIVCTECVRICKSENCNCTGNIIFLLLLLMPFQVISCVQKHTVKNSILSKRMAFLRNICQNVFIVGILERDNSEKSASSDSSDSD